MKFSRNCKSLFISILSEIVQLTINAHNTNVAYVCLSGMSDAVVSGMLQLFKSLKVSASIIHKWYTNQGTLNLKIIIYRFV